MTTDTQQPVEMGTKPVPEHQWLNNLVGEWTTETEMTMPDNSQSSATGTETVRNLNGLWALGEGRGQMPDGQAMEYRSGLGYDVSFKEYRGFWLASVSSHLWKYTGTLSQDGKTMTLNCVGPDMVNDGQTANYRDVIELIDDNHRTLTSYGEGENGEWCQFMKTRYTRK
jgi:hypothetical protein